MRDIGGHRTAVHLLQKVLHLTDARGSLGVNGSLQGDAMLSFAKCARRDGPCQKYEDAGRLEAQVAEDAHLHAQASAGMPEIFELERPIKGPS